MEKIFPIRNQSTAYYPKFVENVKNLFVLFLYPV